MRHFFILTALLLIGCVETFEGDFTSSSSNNIVITGGITNYEMPEVRIYFSAPIGVGVPPPQPVHEANVYIEDDAGVRIPMEEVADQLERDSYFFPDPAPEPDGFATWEDYLEVFWNIDTLTETVNTNFRYEPVDKQFRGKIGKSYKLTVELPDGPRYESSPQILTSSPPITNAYAEVEKGNIINELGNEESAHWWNVFVETTTSPDQETHLNWRYKGVFEVETFPEEYCESDGAICNREVGTERRRVPPGCCKYCYITEYGSDFPLAQSSEVAAGRVVRQIAKIPVTASKIYNYYKLDIYQLSVTPEVYQYLDLLNRQITAQGTIFDPVPAPLKGNMLNVENSSETALGMFYVAGMSSTQLNLTRDGIEFQFSDYRFPNDCRQFENSSNERPSDYISGNDNLCYNYYADEWHSCDQCYDIVHQTWSACPK